MFVIPKSKSLPGFQFANDRFVAVGKNPPPKLCLYWQGDVCLTRFGNGNKTGFQDSQHCCLRNKWNFLYTPLFQLYRHCFSWHCQHMWLRCCKDTLPVPPERCSCRSFSFVRRSPNENLWLTLSWSHAPAGFPLKCLLDTFTERHFYTSSSPTNFPMIFNSLKLPFNLCAHPSSGEQLC